MRLPDVSIAIQFKSYSTSLSKTQRTAWNNNQKSLNIKHQIRFIITDLDIGLLRFIDRLRTTITKFNMKINHDQTKILALSRSQNMSLPISWMNSLTEMLYMASSAAWSIDAFEIWIYRWLHKIPWIAFTTYT